MDLRPRRDLSCRLIDGEVVILDRENDRIHQLNATASLVWQRLDGKIGLLEIANELTERYDVGREAALADVKRVVSELQDLDLIVRHDGGD